MAAQVFAPAAGFRVAHHAGTFRGSELRVYRQGRQIAAVRHPELLPLEGNLVFDLGCTLGVGLQALHELQQTGFKFAAEDGAGSQFAEQRAVHGGVQAVKGEVGLWIEGADVFRDLNGDSGRGVHGHVEGDKVGGQYGVAIEAAAGQILAGERYTRLPQPGGG